MVNYNKIEAALILGIIYSMQENLDSICTGNDFLRMIAIAPFPPFLQRNCANALIFLKL